MNGALSLRDVRIKLYLEQMFSDPEAPRSVGRSYLEIYPQEADKRQLMWSILGAKSPQDLDTFRRVLHSRRNQDFHRENFVIVDGWMLSRTEARLCALTRLLQDFDHVR